MKTLKLYDDIISGGNSFITQETAASKPVIYNLFNSLLRVKGTDHRKYGFGHFLFFKGATKNEGGAKPRVTRED